MFFAKLSTFSLAPVHFLYYKKRKSTGNTKEDRSLFLYNYYMIHFTSEINRYPHHTQLLITTSPGIKEKHSRKPHIFTDTLFNILKKRVKSNLHPLSSFFRYCRKPSFPPKVTGATVCMVQNYNFTGPPLLLGGKKERIMSSVTVRHSSISRCPRASPGLGLMQAPREDGNPAAMQWRLVFGLNRRRSLQRERTSGWLLELSK